MELSEGLYLPMITISRSQPPSSTLSREEVKVLNPGPPFFLSQLVDISHILLLQIKASHATIFTNQPSIYAIRTSTSTHTMDPAFLEALRHMPSGWELLGQQNPMMSQPNDSEMSSLQTKLHSAENQLKGMSTSLDPIASQCGRDTVTKLEIAMMKLYKLAVFIRGDYDNREPDNAQQDALLEQAVAGFKAVEESVQSGLEKICQLQAQVSEVEQAIVNPARKDFEAGMEQKSLELQNIEEKIKTSEDAIEMMRKAMDMLSGQLDMFSRKLSDVEEARRANTTIVSTYLLVFMSIISSESASQSAGNNFIYINIYIYICISIHTQTPR